MARLNSAVSFLLFAALLAPLSAQPSRHIRINELLASNVTTNAEIADFNDFSDWVELYNADTADVDIGGCFLTDKRGTLANWQFPPGTLIRAKGTLLIWADGEDEIPGRTYERPYYPFDTFITKYYHANLKLDRAGEFLAFVGQDSVIIDSVSYGLQHSDVSFGRQPDGGSSWMFFGEPTPSASNATPGLTIVVFAEPPSFSLPGGQRGCSFVNRRRRAPDRASNRLLRPLPVRLRT